MLRALGGLMVAMALVGWLVEANAAPSLVPLSQVDADSTFGAACLKGTVQNDWGACTNPAYTCPYTTFTGPACSTYTCYQDCNQWLAWRAGMGNPYDTYHNVVGVACPTPIINNCVTGSLFGCSCVAGTGLYTCAGVYTKTVPGCDI